MEMYAPLLRHRPWRSLPNRVSGFLRLELVSHFNWSVVNVIECGLERTDYG